MAGDDKLLKKHSIVIAGHQTSITLETLFWRELKDIARQRKISLNRLVAEIDRQRQGNLCSAVRVFILEHHLKKRED